eukprot:7487078-Pyramimonas_sp.AAC.1
MTWKDQHLQETDAEASFTKLTEFFAQMGPLFTGITLATSKWSLGSCQENCEFVADILGNSVTILDV